MRAHGLLDIGQLRQYVARPQQKPFAFRGQLHTPGGAGDQANAQLLLQPRQSAADAGWREAQLLRRVGERALVDNADEDPQGFGADHC